MCSRNFIGNLRVTVFQIDFSFAQGIFCFLIHPFPTNGTARNVLQFIYSVFAFDQSHSGRLRFSAFHTDLSFQMIWQLMICCKRIVHIVKILILPVCLDTVGIVYYIKLFNKRFRDFLIQIFCDCFHSSGVKSMLHVFRNQLSVCVHNNSCHGIPIFVMFHPKKGFSCNLLSFRCMPCAKVTVHREAFCLLADLSCHFF